MTLPYLYSHQNRHAPVRANGRRFHGYPSRSQRVRLIAVHTTESVFDQLGADGGAEAVAAFQSTTDRPSSYHRIVDRDSTVVCLPDEATAFGVGGLNSPTLHLSFAMRAADWSNPAKAAAARPTLERAADVAAEWCREYGIALHWLTRDQAFGNGIGFVRHGTADPGRRSDPGADFPAALFLELVADRLTPAKPKPAPTVEVDIATLPVLSRGATGAFVKRAQAILAIVFGHRITTDGDYGPATEKAVRAVQAKAGVPVTGQVDLPTWYVLIAARKPTAKETA